MVFSINSILENKPQRIMQFIYIISFFVVMNLAEGQLSKNEDVKFYNTYVYRYVQLLPNTDKILLTLNGSLYLKPYKQYKNTLIAGVVDYSVQFSIVNATGKHVVEYPQSKNLHDAYMKPVVVIYNEDGSFNKLVVDKNEENLSVNIKLLFLTFIQNQMNKKLQANENHVIFDTKEQIGYGTCSVNYYVRKAINPNKSSQIYLRKSYNAESCTRTNTTNIQQKNKNYISQLCSKETKETYDRTLTACFEVEQLSEKSTVTNVEINEHMHYKPYAENSKILLIDQTTMGNLMYPTTTIEINDQMKPETDTVTQMRLTDVNISLLKDSNNTKDQQLRDVYKVLACQHEKLNIMMDIVERAILNKI